MALWLPHSVCREQHRHCYRMLQCRIARLFLVRENNRGRSTLFCIVLRYVEELSHLPCGISEILVLFFCSRRRCLASCSSRCHFCPLVPLLVCSLTPIIAVSHIHQCNAAAIHPIHAAAGDMTSMLQLFARVSIPNLTRIVRSSSDSLYVSPLPMIVNS